MVGLIGIMYLQRVLTAYGRPDIALRFATKTEYPSWGYMAKNGATTIWELWNGNTADPAMNSGNHAMLLGDLIIWIYENIGGIKPGEPGFKEILMKPIVTEELRSATASHHSPYGKIYSSWELDEDNNFTWDIEIPVNTTAKINLPANGRSDVREGNRKITRAGGVKLLGFKDGVLRCEITSGSYHFISENVSFPKNSHISSAAVKISPGDGPYRFSTISDDGSRLFVNDTMVVDNDGIHGPFISKGKIELKRGKYPFMLDFFEGNYGEILRVEIEGPGMILQSLPVSML